MHTRTDYLNKRSLKSNIIQLYPGTFVIPTERFRSIQQITGIINIKITDAPNNNVTTIKLENNNRSIQRVMLTLHT